MRQPLGVCAGITPFNFPAMVPMWMFPVALACGNTFVLKPSERDPSPSLRMAELLQGSRAARRRVQRRARRQGGGRRAARASRTSRRSRSSARRRSRSTSTRPARAHGKRVQALGGAKNHVVVHARRRPRLRRRGAHRRGLRLGRRALHGDLGGRRGRRRRPTRWSSGSPRARASAQDRARRRARTSRWGRSSPRARASASPGYIDAGVERGRDAGRRRPRPSASPGHEQGFFVGPTLFDRRHARR